MAAARAMRWRTFRGTLRGAFRSWEDSRISMLSVYLESLLDLSMESSNEPNITFYF